MNNLKGIMEVFEIFHIKDSSFDETDKNKSNRMIINQIIVICVFSFIYGIVMGSYHSFLQSIVAGVKVAFLFIVSTAICFPSFFIIQQVLGSKMSIRLMIIIVLSGLMLTSSIIVAFTPIVILFQLTGGNYHFLQLFSFVCELTACGINIFSTTFSEFDNNIFVVNDFQKQCRFFVIGL